jgi:uncharacterized protein YndB with AHSA1/START domain
MKIRIEKTIDARLHDVWDAFDNPDNLSRWQPTLESWTHEYGTSGQPDSIAELIYNENGRKVTMTVTGRRQPDFLAGTYESAWGKALIVNHFESIDDSTTKWVMYSNMAFKGFMKIMSVFIGGQIRKRNENNMDQFRKFAETESAGGLQ